MRKQEGVSVMVRRCCRQWICLREKYVASTSLRRAGEPDPSLPLGRPHETDVMVSDSAMKLEVAAECGMSS